VFKSVELRHHDTGLVSQWKKLIAWIQRRVEHMVALNDSGVDFARGNVVCMNADRELKLADDALGSELYVGVMAGPCADGTTGIVRTDNLAYVLFEPGQVAMAAGTACYISQTAGLATNSAVGPALIMQLGLIVDASPYAAEQAAWVMLNRCCQPTEQG